jgi:hypothetical protein
MLHQLAAPLADKGKLIVASYGQDPVKTIRNEKNGSKARDLVPKVCHFAIGAVNAMADTIISLTKERHRNVYCPWAVMSKDLPDGEKGGEADIIGVLALISDFDDPEAVNWRNRLPIPASYALETSADRFQAFCFADRPLPPANAKSLAIALKGVSHCDHGSVDMSHVWRVPGTRNWPNAKKVKEGRPLDPQVVCVIQPWDGTFADFSGLSGPAAEEPLPPQPNGHDQTAHLDEDTAAIIVKLPRWILNRLRMPVTPSVDRSKVLFPIIGKLCELDFDDPTIARILSAFPDGVASKYIGRFDAEVARVRAKTAPRRAVEGKAGRFDPKLDETAIADVAAQEQDALDQLIADFNANFFIVNEAGKVWVCQWRRDPVIDRDRLEYIRHGEFKKFYENRLLTITLARGAVTKSLAEWWLTAPDRRQYLGGVCFDPTNQAPASYFNLWRGFNVQPKIGDWSLMRNHIIHVICRGNQAHADWVLNWLARLVQYPHLQGEVALVLRGSKGCGKGIVGRWIVALFGRHGLQILNVAHLVGRFNEHLRDLVVLFADEAFFAGDRQHEGILKGLVTEPIMPVEGKYKPVVAVKNMLHVILASNQDWVIPASTDERRYCVFDVPDTYCGNLEYFAAIDHQMQNGGLAAMLDDLLRRDISKFQFRDAPKTEALGVQKLLSLQSVERWWVSVLSRGFLWRSRFGAPYFREWHEFYSTALLDHSYQQWCEENRPYDRKAREALGKFMTKVYQPTRPKLSEQHPVYEIESIREDLRDIAGAPLRGEDLAKKLDEVAIVRKERPTGYQVGNLEAARSRFLECYKIPAEWQNEQELNDG